MVDNITGKVVVITGASSGMGRRFAETLQEFHIRAHVGLQSAAGYEEGKALPVSW